MIGWRRRVALAATKIDTNTANMTARKTSVPHSLCVSTASNRSVHVTGRRDGFVTAADRRFRKRDAAAAAA